MTLSEIKTLIRSIDRSPGVYSEAGLPKSLAAKLVERIEKLSEALSYYANKEHIYKTCTNDGAIEDALREEGETAQAALSKYGKDEL